MECLLQHPALFRLLVVVEHLLYLLLLLLLLLFLFLLGLSTSLSTSILLALRGLRISSLLAWPHAEPLGQLLGRALLELGQLLLPHALQPFGPDDLSAALVELLPVAIGPGVRPPLVLGEHVDGGGVLLGEGLGVQALLDGLVPQLQLLPLGQLLELVVLVQLPLLVVVLVSLQGNDGVPDLVRLPPQLIRVHGVEVEGLDADGKGDLHLLFDLFLGLGHLLAGIHGRASGLLATLLLGGEHLLPLPLVVFHLLLLGQGLCLSLLCLFLLDLLLLGPLCSGLLLLLLGPDLLPGGLFVLEPLELGLLLGPFFPPLRDVLLQLLVHLPLLGLVFGRGHLDE